MLPRSREKIRNFRLSPTEVDLLVRKMVSNLQQGKYYEVKDWVRFCKEGRNFIILPMCKDAETPWNEPSLECILTVITEFLAKNKEDKSTLLIPLGLCRGYLKGPISFFQRKHAVLVEADLAKMTIQVYDSQGTFRKFFYPDKLVKLIDLGFSYNPVTDYHAYGMQEGGKEVDNYSCAYYVLAMIYHILQHGKADGCENLKLNVAEDYNDKWDFFKQCEVDIQRPNSFIEDNVIEEFSFEEFAKETSPLSAKKFQQIVESVNLEKSSQEASLHIGKVFARK